MNILIKNACVILPEGYDDCCSVAIRNGEIAAVGTVPADFRADRAGARRIARRYPAAAQDLLDRAPRYNAGVARALALEREGRALVLSPDDFPPMRPLKKDVRALLALYDCGRQAAGAIAPFLGA